MRQNKQVKAGSKVVEGLSNPPPIDVQQQIATHAYFRSEARGFAPGSELDDWLAAEAEVTDPTKSN